MKINYGHSNKERTTRHQIRSNSRTNEHKMTRRTIIARLESGYAARCRGFESRHLRQYFDPNVAFYLLVEVSYFICLGTVLGTGTMT